MLGGDLLDVTAVDRIRKAPKKAADTLRGVAEPPQELFDLSMRNKTPSLSVLHTRMLRPARRRMAR